MRKFKIGDVVLHISNRKLRMPVIDVGDMITCTVLTDSGIKKKIDFLPSEIILAADEEITINVNLGKKGL